MDSSPALFIASVAPFVLLILYISWLMGKVSAIAVERGRYGGYSVGYPLAFVFCLLVVVPAMILSSYIAVDDGTVTSVVFASFLLSGISLFFGWNRGVKVYRQSEQAAAAK